MPQSLPPNHRSRSAAAVALAGPDPLRMILCPLVMLCAGGAYAAAALSMGHYGAGTFAFAAVVGIAALDLVPGIARRMNP